MMTALIQQLQLSFDAVGLQRHAGAGGHYPSGFTWQF